MPGDGEVACAGESAVQSEPGVKKFTWQELSKLNQRHNAHVAVRGKVRNHLRQHCHIKGVILLSVN